MAGPDRAVEVIARVTKAVIAEMSGVEDDVEPFHLAQGTALRSRENRR